jgi:hypothetical protein
MKKLFILNLLIMISIGASAQGLSNIFNQKAADLKSMGKQIVLLQLYIRWIEKGYNIARSGLTLIGEIKQGEFNLHSVFFGSLSSVSPAIRRYSKVAAIIDYELSVIRELSKIPAIKNLTTSEMAYLLTVKENLLQECLRILDKLTDVIADNTYQMSDDERIKQVDLIYYDMGDKWFLAKQFTQEASMISVQRQKDISDIRTLENLE